MYIGITQGRFSAVASISGVRSQKAGAVGPTYRSALSSIRWLEKKDPDYWTFDDWGEVFGLINFGDTHYRFKPTVESSDSHQTFLFQWSTAQNLPSLLTTFLAKHFMHTATCVACHADLSEIRKGKLSTFDCQIPERQACLACPCGYGVWRMKNDLYHSIENKLNQYAAVCRRKWLLKIAGGKYSRGDLKAIERLQHGRCIYCSKRFSTSIPVSVDHFLPVTSGGSSWPLNIVLSCRHCNWSRGSLPFRTYCKLLSPDQNQRILANLQRRLNSIDLSLLSDIEINGFLVGLALHAPRHPRFLSIQNTKTVARRNAKANKLLPRSAITILKGTWK